MSNSPFYPFDCFLTDLGRKVHDLENDPLKIYLAETVSAGGTTFGDVAGIPSGGGYEISGANISASYSNGILTGGSHTWTASSGLDGEGEFFNGFGYFRYVVLYNAITSGPGAGKVIGYWDYGQRIKLEDQEQFRVVFSSNIFTITPDLLLEE